MTRPALRLLTGLSLAAALVALPACAHGLDEKEPFGRLTVDEVEQLVAGHQGFVFDNNSKERFAKSHVAGAKWLPFNDFEASALPPDKGAKLVFYCANPH